MSVSEQQNGRTMELPPAPADAVAKTTIEMPKHNRDGDKAFGDMAVLKEDKEVQPLMIIPSFIPKPTDKKKHSSSYTPILRQSMGMAGPLFAIISSGMTSGFSGILLPQLEHPNSTIPITKEQASWIAGMAALPMALGCIISGLVMERYGRKLSQQVLCVPYVVGWVVLSLASNIDLLYLGRFLTGLCVGLIGPVTTVYIAEMSGPKYRGVFLAVVSLGVAMGILLAHVLGTYLSWRLTAAISAALPFICYCIISCLPESPSWLAAQGKTQQAQETFTWFRGDSEEANTELKLLIIKSNKQREEDKLNKENKATWSEYRKIVLDGSFLKPFCIMNTFFFILQFSGVNAVAFYTVSMLKDVGLAFDEYLATIIIDVVRVVMSVCACILLRKVGRRPLAIISGIGTAISLLGLGFYLRYWRGNEELRWLPMMLFVVYICFISIGYVPLPWVMIGEVFPSATRGLGSGSSSCFGFLVFFIVVKTSPGLFLQLGKDGAFFLYGAVATCGIFFLYFFLPETMNRTLQDIEDRYKQKKDKPSNDRVNNDV